jgi:hypothetical protein
MWLIPCSIRSAYAPGSECLTKESDVPSAILALPIERLPMVNGKRPLPASLSRSWKRERWSQRLFGAAIFDSCQQDSFTAWWTSLFLGSRVPTYRSPGAAPALMGSAADFSSMSSMPPTLAVRGASLWRTSAPSLLPPPPLWTKPKASSTSARPPESWENWPTAGGTRNGSLFQRPMWVPATGGQGGSASPGDERRTTPQAHDITERGSGQQPTAKAGNACLARDSRTWTTPSATDGECGGMLTEAMSGTSLTQQVNSMWRTPDAPGDGGPRNRQGSRGKGHQVTIAEQAEHWPSPRATDGTKGGPNQAGSKGDLMLPSAAAQWQGTAVPKYEQEWPTPTALDRPRSPETLAKSAAFRKANANQNTVPLYLGEVAMNWPTPASRDYRAPNSQSYKERGGGMKGEQLNNFVEHSLSLPQAPAIPDGPESSQSDPGLRRRLNPMFGAWLMEWPCWWTNPGITSCARSAMELYRCRQQQALSSLFAEPKSSSKP